MICEILTDYQKLYTGIVAGKFAVKWLLKITPCLSTLTYKDRHQVLGLQSSESRRLQFDLIYAYKILTGRIDINITSVSPYSHTSPRGATAIKIYLPGCRTDARKFFFALRVIHPWNSLKLTPASMSSLCHFKALLRNAELSRFLHYLLHYLLAFHCNHMSILHRF